MRRLLEPKRAAGATPSVSLASEEFARRLHRLMVQKNMRQSDLARAVWGTTHTPDGKLVAKNRDRISVYLKGQSWPDPQNLEALARALGVTREELAPDIMASAVERENPELSIVVVAGHSDKVHLRVNKLVSYEVALKIATLLGGGNVVPL